MSVSFLTYRLSIDLLREQKRSLIADIERHSDTLSAASYYAIRSAIAEYEHQIKNHPEATPSEASACTG